MTVSGEETVRPKGDNNDWYFGIGFFVGLLGFAGIWLYALDEWGLLIGLVFGWIPALIGGIILGLLWPLVALVIGWLLLQGL